MLIAFLNYFFSPTWLKSAIVFGQKRGLVKKNLSEIEKLN